MTGRGGSSSSSGDSTIEKIASAGILFFKKHLNSLDSKYKKAALTNDKDVIRAYLLEVKSVAEAIAYAKTDDPYKVGPSIKKHFENSIKYTAGDSQWNIIKEIAPKLK